jgi:hypothetical protein
LTGIKQALNFEAALGYSLFEFEIIENPVLVGAGSGPCSR